MSPLWKESCTLGCCLLTLLLTVGGLPGSSGAPLAWAAAAYEQPTTLKASQVLPRELLSGPDFTVEEPVQCDGYLNTYTIRSTFGSFRATSTALLAIRIQEIRAMAAMQQVSGADEFGSRMVASGERLVDGAVNLITDPLNTLGSAASGVGKLFTRAQERIAGNSTSKYEESTASNLTGFARTKREYAKAFGVDPYSTNQALQTALDNVSSAGYAADITGMALKALIPGGVGVATSAVGGVNWLHDFDVALPPTELHAANRQRLKDMGLSEELVSRFMANDEYTPTQQTLLVLALASMPRTGGKADFIQLAATTRNQDQALFRQRMAQMYAGYDRSVERIESFVPLGHLVGGKTASGKLVLCFPLDYLLWTERTAAAVDDIVRNAPGGKPKSVTLWLTGQASKKAQGELQRLQVGVHEHAGQQLLGERL